MLLKLFFAVMLEIIRNNNMKEGKEDVKRKDRLPDQPAGELVSMNSQL